MVFICISVMISETEYFYMLVGHLYIILREMFFQILCSIFNWAVSFIVVEIQKVFKYTEYVPPCQIYDWQVFSPFL